MSRSGTVVEFDEHSGLGVIEEQSGRRWPFHCTRIADGSRTIAVGTPVGFSVEAGHAGLWEASAVSSGSR